MPARFSPIPHRAARRNHVRWVLLAIFRTVGETGGVARVNKHRGGDGGVSHQDLQFCESSANCLESPVRGEGLLDPFEDSRQAASPQSRAPILSFCAPVRALHRHLTPPQEAGRQESRLAAPGQRKEPAIRVADPYLQMFEGRGSPLSISMTEAAPGHKSRSSSYRSHSPNGGDRTSR